MEKADCEGPRPKCEFSAKDAMLICGLQKEAILNLSKICFFSLE
jgi:hypothetical protein